MSDVQVRVVGRGASVSDWISVPPLVHANDPHFVRELDLKERMRVSRRFNPFFDFGEACLFVACRDGVPVGRISAPKNRPNGRGDAAWAPTRSAPRDAGDFYELAR